MPKSQDNTYCLVQSNLDPIDPEVLKLAFRAVEELVDNDAKTLSADAFGILADGLTPDSARTIANGLARAGISVDIVPQSKIPNLPDSHTLRRAGCFEECFMATDSLGRDVPLAWSSVVSIAAGMVPIRESKRIYRKRYKSVLTRSISPSVGMAMIAGRGGVLLGAYWQSMYAAPERDISIRYKTKSHGLLDVFVDCKPYYYRIWSDKFNYSYLGQQQSKNRLENFAAMVGDFTRYASGAALNRGAVAINTEGLDATFGYPTRHAFGEETIWLLYQFGLSRSQAWPWMVEP